MKGKTKWCQVIVIITLLWGGMACTPVQEEGALTYAPPKPEPEVMVAKRFQEPDEGRQTVAESTLVLSERYTELTEVAAQLRAENRDLTEENQAYQKRVSALETDLKQTQAELAEANSLLMDILGELNTWKSDVLGFRNEMRLASKAQLEALLKILGILGADVSGGAGISVAGTQEVKP